MQIKGVLKQEITPILTELFSSLVDMVLFVIGGEGKGCCQLKEKYQWKRKEKKFRPTWGSNPRH